MTGFVSDTPIPQQASVPDVSIIRAGGDVPASPYQDSLAALWRRYNVEPVRLVRTREGRSLSRQRYRTSEEFMPSADPAVPLRRSFLYFTGITAQLAIASHLLDVGFSDEWCARHIGLHIDRSLAFANATGFGCDCNETQRLADVLSPYWKWNSRSQFEMPKPNDGGFTQMTVTPLLQALLAHVRHVTGHESVLAS